MEAVQRLGDKARRLARLIEMLRTELAMTKEEYRQALADELRRLTNE